MLYFDASKSFSDPKKVLDDLLCYQADYGIEEQKELKVNWGPNAPKEYSTLTYAQLKCMLEDAVFYRNQENVQTEKILTRVVPGNKPFLEGYSYTKYSFHDWEKYLGLNYGSFMKGIESEWNIISEQLSDEAKETIHNFLFSTTPCWGKKEIKFGWSSPGLKEWCDKNNSYKTWRLNCDGFRDGNNCIQVFSQIVKLFKEEIGIKY